MSDRLTTVNHFGPIGIILVLLSGWLALPPSTSWAATYYVDGSNPSARDTNPGTQAQPWKTIGKATGLVRPGDTVYIKAGVYRETIVLSKSGTSTTAYTRDGWVTTTSPITIAAYPGHEGKVIINAAEPVTNWRKCTGPQDCAGNPNWSHIYWADVAGLVAAHPDQDFAIRQVFQNGQRLPRSRFPDTGWSYPTTVVNPKTTFSDSTLSMPEGYFNGAVCHIKTAPWAIDPIPIASSSGHTIVLAANVNIWYDISTRFGYYITSIVGEINAAGEWAYDAARRRLYLWPRGEVANNVEFSYRKDCVRTDFWVSHVVVRGLTMRYSHEFGAWVFHASNITLENNTIEYAWRHGIDLRSTWGPCNDNQILRNTFKYCASRAINVDSAAERCRIEGNYAYATGVEHYGGDVMNGVGTAIYVVGPSARVYGNRIDRTGGTGLFLHDGALNREVSYNYITNSGLVLADTSALYMYGRTDGPDKDYIHHNIVVDTPGCQIMDKDHDVGAPVTLERYAGWATGIGVDEEANHRIIEDNTVIRSSRMGIGLHVAPGNVMQRNTLYGNGIGQVGFQGDNKEHRMILDEVLLDNILFATDAQQKTMHFLMEYNNVHFGQSDRNWFYNPYNYTHIFVSRYLTPDTWEHHDYLDLSGWQALSGYDRNSREFSYLERLPGVTLVSPTESRIVYNASLDVNTVDLGPDLYCDVQGHGVRGKLTLQPFESKILIAAVAAPISHQARDPVPADGGQVGMVPLLKWTAAATGAFHNVYLGTDKNVVSAADVTSSLFRGRQTGTSFSLQGLVQPGGRYYWRVDEVEADGTTVHPGIVWTFTVQSYLAIDDFESYTDTQGRRIGETWSDGSRNHTGAQVGRASSASAGPLESTHGAWSMFLAYDNTRAPFVSEVEREFAPEQDWTAGGMNTLTLWVRGYPAPQRVAVTETAGKITLTGDGTDIWNNSDQFTFAYKTLNGDGSMTARVVSIGPGSNTWAKAGVMIRDSLDGGSTHAMMVMTANSDGTAGNGASFQYRPAADGASFNNDSASVVKPPYWVKINRLGGSLSGSYSADGKTWRPLGAPQRITMTAPVYIGLCVTSHAAGEQRTFRFDSITTTGSVTGSWQGAVIDSARSNGAASLYVTVEDSAGKAATVTDPALVNAAAWTEWKIPLGSFPGVDLHRVKKMSIGVGSRESPIPPGTGRIYLDDIQVWKP